MYIISPTLFEKRFKKMGFKSIGQLAKQLGIHRNTIHYYLSGHSVFPQNLSHLFDLLDLKPHDILIKKEGTVSTPIKKIAPIINTLQRDFPGITFVLFGSRAKSKETPYSDFDIGIFSKKGIPHETYRLMRQNVGELEETFPYHIDLVNFNNADISFLKNALKGAIFLGGFLVDWTHLTEEVLGGEI